MKKSLLLLALISILFAWPSHAQTTLTVADGTNYSTSVPISGGSASYYLRDQVIYPAEMLTEMEESNISAIKFYLRYRPYRAWGAVFDVKLGITSSTSFSSSTFLSDPVITLYTGTLTIDADSTMTILLDQPFTYMGGNLLLEIATVTTGENVSAQFFGISSQYGSLSGTASYSGSNSGTRQNFTPKTTFTFTYQDVCRPRHLSVSDVIGSSALLKWQEGHTTASSYEISYKVADAVDWTIAAANTTDNALLLSGLQPQTHYQVRARALCGGEYSDYVTNDFTTQCIGGYTNPVVIGTPDKYNSSSFGFPMAMSYPYSYSQQIFRAEEIGSSRMIDSIFIQYISNTPMTRNVDIYLGHTSNLVFNNSNSYVPLDDLTLVYSGEITFNNSGNNYWFGIPLDTTFAYNGTDNLVVAFDDNTGTSYSSGNGFLSHLTPNSSRLAWYSYHSSSDVSPASPNGYSYTDYHRNNIRFPSECISDGCDRANIIVTNITDASVQLQFTAGNGASGIELQYKRSADETYTTVPVSGTSHQLTGLKHNTEYVVRIRSLCAGSQSNWKEVTFHTTPRYYPIIYVTVGGTGDGGSWATATGDLNWALNTAAAVHNTYGIWTDVWVAEGTYYGNTASEYAFTMEEGVYAYGGFAGNETELSQRNFYAHPSYLDGQNSRTVLYQPAHFSEATLWDGFVIQNGYSTSTAGGAILKSGSYLYDSQIINNTGASGGILASYAVIDNCQFRGNVSTGSYSDYGGGAAKSSYSRFFHCSFTNNRAENNGGAIFITDANTSYITLSNCLIANNTAKYGGGVYSQSGSTIIENTTIVNNEASNSGAGIYATSLYRLVNSLIWGNRTTAGILSSIYNTSNTFTTLYCAIEGGYSGTGNIVLMSDSVLNGVFAPKFVHPSATVGYADNTPNVDWHLQNGSVCVNHGSNYYVTYYNSNNNSDLDFGIRIKNDTVDIGCYESNYYGTALPEYGNVIYVTQNGSGTRDGSSWANATDDIFTAMSLADMYNADVWVAEGVYYGDTLSDNAFTLRDGVNIYGGFAGNETSLSQRDLTAHVSALDGGNARRVIYQASTFTTLTILDGFTIQNGYYPYTNNGGAGGYLRANSMLSNCTITNNHSNRYGGGIYGYGHSFNGNDTIYLINCVFSHNTSMESGGGAYMSQYIFIDNCTFTHNSTDRTCGALDLYEGYLSNCVFTHNTSAENDGGLSVDNCLVYNCLVANNTSGSGCSGMSASRCQIYNCTIVNNESRSTGTSIGFGFEGPTSASSTYSTTLTNCLVWGNRCNNSTANYSGHVNCTYSAVEGGINGAHNIALASENDSNNPFCPRFVHPSDSVGAFDAPDNADWRLADGSPCVNRGSNAALIFSTDISGNARVQQDTTDMGCYESEYNSIGFPPFGNIVYVTEEGAGTQLGNSWENATPSLMGAINIARNYGADVWVAAGTYYGNTSSSNAFTIVEGVNVYGGFAGNEPADYDLSLRDFETNATILDGQGMRRVLYQPYHFEDSTAAVWDGFTIQNGAWHDHGAGVYMLSYASLINCIIQYNYVYYKKPQNSTSNSYYVYGAGVFADGSYYSSVHGTHLKDCIIRYNSFENSNNLDGSGAGLYGLNVNVERTEICYNTCPRNNSNGGGFYTRTNNSRFVNCLIHNNKAYRGGGVYLNGSVDFINCDIVNNTATNSGGGVYNSGTFKNCIIWGNKRNYNVDNISSSSGSYTYCAVEGGRSGTGNLNLASANDGYDQTLNYVRFIDPVNGDFQLHPTSSCINLGNNEACPDSLDLYGNPRVFNSIIDIGCSEVQDHNDCPSIVNLQVSNITTNSAQLSWHPMGQETQWVVLYGETGGNSSTITVSDTLCTLMGLSLNRNYTAKVRALCGDGMMSVFSIPVNFQTICNPEELDTLSNFSQMTPTDSEIVYQNQVSFNWLALPEATSYDFYIWAANDNMPETPNLSGLSFAGVSNFSLPNFEHGKYYHWKVVAWNECISKSSPVMTIRVNPLPDLHVSAVTHSNPVASQPLTVTWTVSNDGEGGTSPGVIWYDRIWLGRDADVREFNQNQDILLATIPNLQVLNSGESYTNTATVTLPEGIMGNYYLFVMANQHDAFNIDFEPSGGTAPDPYTPSITGDPYPYLFGYCHNYDMEEVYQRTYNNGFSSLPNYDNFFYVVLNILPPPSPDLVVSSIAHPTNTFSGNTIPLTWTITNQGEATASGSWYDVLYLSPDSLLSTTDAWRVGRYKHTGDLAADSSYSFSEQVTIPIDYIGDYYFFVVTDNNDEIYEGLGSDNNIGMSAIPLRVSLTPPADLIVTEINVPDALDVNSTYNITYKVKNNGSSPTYGDFWYDYVYISRDSVYSQNSARLLKRISHSGTLAADSSYSKTNTIPLPADLEGGRWYILVYTDAVNNIFEYIYEDNNVMSLPVTVMLPDLVVTDIQVADTVDPNTTISVKWTVRNNGPGNAVRRSFTDHILFNGELLYTAEVNNLNFAAGDSMVRTANIQLPCPGDAALLSITTDVASKVLEGDESNNTLSVPLNILTPDLTVSGVTISEESLWSGTAVTVTHTVINEGATPATGSITDNIYFSTSSTTYSEGDFAGSYTHSLSLAPDEIKTVTATVTVPNGISGQYYCHVLCNASNDICEAAGSVSNTAHSTPVGVQLSPWPDIVVTSVSVEGPIHLGATFPVEYTLANNGTAAIHNTGVINKFYYSTSPSSFDENNLILSQMNYLNMATGGEETLTAYLALPANELPGFYYIHIVVDATNLVYEHTDENNNSGYSNRFTASVYQLDMMAVEIEGPEILEWGQTANYRLHVRNNSQVPTIAAQWKDVMYLSDDQALHNTDRLLGSVQRQTVLNPGEDYWADFTVTIPFGTTSDAYLIGVTDFYFNNPDINYSNNSSTKFITVNSVPTPDIAVTAFEVLDDVASGQPARAAYTVTNSGDQDITLQSCTDKIFLSADSIYQNTDIELVTKTRQNITLAQGESYTDTLTFTVPLPYNGNMYLIIRTNTANNPFEANQDNNKMTVPVSITLNAPGDLVVTDITCESSIVSGSVLHASWRVLNIGDNILSGNGLRSLLYISTDNQFDANDRLLGSVVSNINLGLDESIQQAIECRISGLTEGEYYLIVKTDVTNAFYEVDETNNTGSSLDPFEVTIRPLPFNTDVADVLYNDSPSDFRMEVGDNTGQTVRIHVTSEDSLAGAVNMIYATHNSMGNNLNYSYSTIGQYTANPELYIPATTSGYYGVNVYGSTPAGNEQNTVIRADILPFELMAVDADHGGNTGVVTVELTGSRFRPNMQVCLRNGSDTICADSLIYVNYYKAFAQFNLAGHSPGVFDVSAENFCEGESVLYEGFEIQEGVPDGLAYNLIFPSSPRPNRNIVMMLEFGNIGNLDLHDQVLEITSMGGCPIALTPEGVTAGETTLLVPLNIEGQPQGLLRPGSYGTINIYGYTSGGLVFTLKPIKNNE